MSVNKLSIKSFTIKDIIDNPGLFEEYEDPSKFIRNCNAQWAKKLTSNPCAQETDLALILAVDDQTVIGRLGLYSAQVNYDGKNEKTFWGDGFFLNDEYKNTGIGGLILLKAISFSKSLLASGGFREDCKALYLGTGFHELGPLKRFIYFYSSRVVIEKYLHASKLCSFFSYILNPLISLFYKMKTGNKKFVLNYRHVESFDSRIDELIRSAQSLNCFPKNAALLNWVLQNTQNINAFEIFRDDELIGYCLLKYVHQEEGHSPEYLPEMEIGSLLDYFVADNSENNLRDLILFCLDFFKKKNVDLCTIQVHDPLMVSICKKYGLIHKGGNQVCFRPSPGIKFDRDQKWFLTQGTSDVILGESI